MSQSSKHRLELKLITRRFKAWQLWKASTGPPHATKYTAETSVLTTSTRTATTATAKKFASR